MRIKATKKRACTIAGALCLLADIVVGLILASGILAILQYAGIVTITFN